MELIFLSAQAPQDIK